MGCERKDLETAALCVDESTAMHWKGSSIFGVFVRNGRLIRCQVLDAMHKIVVLNFDCNSAKYEKC